MDLFGDLKGVLPRRDLFITSHISIQSHIASNLVNFSNVENSIRPNSYLLTPNSWDPRRVKRVLDLPLVHPLADPFAVAFVADGGGALAPGEDGFKVEFVAAADHHVAQLGRLDGAADGLFRNAEETRGFGMLRSWGEELRVNSEELVGCGPVRPNSYLLTPNSSFVQAILDIYELSQIEEGINGYFYRLLRCFTLARGHLNAYSPSTNVSYEGGNNALGRNGPVPGRYN
jgi:hypothetical protein